MTPEAVRNAADMLGRLELIKRALARGVTVRSIYNDDIEDLVDAAAFARMQEAIDAELRSEAAAIASRLASLGDPSPLISGHAGGGAAKGASD